MGLPAVGDLGSKAEPLDSVNLNVSIWLFSVEKLIIQEEHQWSKKTEKISLAAKPTSLDLRGQIFNVISKQGTL